MGMAFQSISDYDASPLFQTLVNNGVTTDSVFAFKLSDSGAELTIGGVNDDLYTGDFTYVPVTQEGYWQVDMDAVSVGSKKAVTGLSAIIDSGTTLIVGDTTNVATFYKSVPGAKSASSTVGDGYYTFPCGSVPSTSITFGGKKFAISADTFNLGPVSEGSSSCVGGIVGDDIGADFWIVGDVFMRNVYTVCALWSYIGVRLISPFRSLTMVTVKLALPNLHELDIVDQLHRILHKTTRMYRYPYHYTSTPARHGIKSPHRIEVKRYMCTD
jgi:cathepsin D